MNPHALALAAVVVICPAVAAPTKGQPGPSRNIVAGVDLDAVDWAQFCTTVKPVTVSRGGVTCSNVYPTSVVVRKYEDFSGVRPNAPPLNCEMLGNEFAEKSKKYTSEDPWGMCKLNFTTELKNRAGSSIKYDDMTLEAWRTKYFEKWVVTGGAK